MAHRGDWGRRGVRSALTGRHMAERPGGGVGGRRGRRLTSVLRTGRKAGTGGRWVPERRGD